MTINAVKLCMDRPSFARAVMWTNVQASCPAKRFPIAANPRPWSSVMDHFHRCSRPGLVYPTDDHFKPRRMVRCTAQQPISSVVFLFATSSTNIKALFIECPSHRLYSYKHFYCHHNCTIFSVVRTKLIDSPTLIVPKHILSANVRMSTFPCRIRQETFCSPPRRMVLKTAVREEIGTMTPSKSETAVVINILIGNSYTTKK